MVLTLVYVVVVQAVKSFNSCMSEQSEVAESA